MRLRTVLRPALAAVLATAGFLLLAPPGAAAQQPTGAAKPAPVLTPDEARRVFTDVLRRYYEAYARQDLDRSGRRVASGRPGLLPAQHPRGRIRAAADVARRVHPPERLGGRRRRARASGRRSRPSPTRSPARSRASAGSATSRCCPTTAGAWKIWNEGIGQRRVGAAAARDTRGGSRQRPRVGPRVGLLRHDLRAVGRGGTAAAAAAVERLDRRAARRDAAGPQARRHDGRRPEPDADGIAADDDGAAPGGARSPHRGARDLRRRGQRTPTSPPPTRTSRTSPISRASSPRPPPSTSAPTTVRGA